MDNIEPIPIKTLSPTQKDFLESKLLEGQFHPGRIMKILSVTSQFDRYSDKKRQQFGKNCGWLFFFGIVLIGITFFLLGSGSIGLVAVGAFSCVIAFSLSLVYWIKKSQLGSRDLNNNIRKFALPVVAIFREEIKPNTKLFVSLKGDDTEQFKYLKESIPREGRLGASTKIYHHPWFSGELTLIDTNHVSFSVERVVHDIEIKKKNARGTKIKYKSKYKVLDSIDIQLTASKKVYRTVQTKSKNSEQIKISEKDDHIVLKAKRKIKSTKPDPMDYQDFLSTLTSLYHRLERI